VDLAKLARSQKDLKPAGIRGLSLANLGRLFAELVHELKNPLQIIVSYADMLSKDLSQPNLTIEQKNNAMSRAVRIQDAVFRMSKLIKLTLNQVQHGENEDFKLVPIAEIISDSLHLTKPALHQKQIHLILNPFPAEWEVRCKAIALSQVLINLLNNAGDAIENLAERWIKINVSEGIQHYSITVIDSGRSIPEEAAKQIFTPFFSSKEGGAGLGLALSQTTIKSHGGNLKLDTEAQNTSFTFTLPKP
jgi:signal transduction histidine kinase